MQPTPSVAAIRTSSMMLSTSSVADGESGDIRIDKCSWNSVVPWMASGLRSPRRVRMTAFGGTPVNVGAA